MSHTSSAVTYTSVYTDSEPGRVFWGADEELSDGGPPQVIVYEYDGRPMQPVAPPSPDYIPDPEENLEGYEDDELGDGPVDYPVDGGDDGDDDDGDSSRDDADDEYEDMDDEDAGEEEKHIAPADSTTFVPLIELVSSPRGTEPITPPPSTDIATTGARITIRLQTSTSLPPATEVKRLLAMPTPLPSPLTSLSPPSAGERLARLMAPYEHSSPPPIPPSLYPPPPVDRRDDILESEQPPRKRVCLSTLGSRHEVGESSTRGRGVDYGFVDTVGAEMRHQDIREVGYGIRDTWINPAEAVPEMAPTTLEEVNTRVTELAELHDHDTQDLYALLEDAQDGRTRISQRVAMDSQRVNLLMRDMMTPRRQYGSWRRWPMLPERLGLIR
nr:hypothetical protein [Tanacetum cinerariifolium]